MWNKFLRSLSSRIEKWFRALHLGWRSLVIWIIGLFLGAIVSGVLGGESLDLWKNLILPWLGHGQSVPNGLLLVIGLGWILFILTFISLWVIYGMNRGNAGRLEIVEKENKDREQTVIQLTAQVTQFTDKVTQSEAQVAQLLPELEQKRKEAKLLDILSSIDRSLFVLLTATAFGEDQKKNFIELIFRRTFDLWGLDKVYRACIYTPDTNDPSFLTIKWEYGVGQASCRWNRWYIGEYDPTIGSRHRGVAGTVYMEGIGKVTPNVLTDPNFMDAHHPPRSALPYRSFVQALIHPDDKQKKLGVLCFDSLSYVFTEHDLTLISQVATRIGWLIQAHKPLLPTKTEGADTNAL